jgi:putative endonuclease
MLASKVTTKSRGDEAEERALAYLLAQGLTLVERNYRVARGPSARGAEVDLIMRDRDPEGTLVFVEVRQRSGDAHGGAAASVSRGKQQRCIRGAQTYLMSMKVWPPCRFDVVAIDGDELEWLVAAFDAS